MNDIAREVFANDYETVNHYVDILASKGIDWGLMGPREADRLWDRHVLNSVAVSQLIPEGLTVADVGSGAGLPGIPLAIARPDLVVTLIEPLLRRHQFLVETLADLGLEGRVRVIRGRAEDCRESFDVVTCRAVAPLPKLVRWCSPLFQPRGMLIAMKGATAEEELLGVEDLLVRARLLGEVRQIRSHPEGELTYAVMIKEV